jgi:hypothetical protein
MLIQQQPRNKKAEPTVEKRIGHCSEKASKIIIKLAQKMG